MTADFFAGQIAGQNTRETATQADDQATGRAADEFSCDARDRDAVDDEGLSRYFDALAREDCYRVDEVLKETPAEVTQRVSLVGAGGTAKWPLIRKFIRRESGMGVAYERIYEAQREGRRFKHIPSVKECYANDEFLVVVMELVVGETLQQLVGRVGPSVDLAKSVYPQLCEAVSELHESFDPPIIHRDLTPSNVVLAKGGLALIDFGIAREYREGAWADTTRFGTRSFAPPEQYGFGQTTVRSDVYALGTLLFFCLAGLVPDMYITDEDFTRAHISLALREVIERATAIDPSNRYGSVRELLAAFQLATRDTNASMSLAATISNPLHPVSEPAVVDGRSKVEGLATSGNEDRFMVLGRLWNICVVFVLGVLLAGCIASFIDPPGANADYPVWLNVIDYLIFMPPFFVSVAWLLFDKRRLAQHFPVLLGLKMRHWAILCVALFVVMFFGIGISNTLYASM